MARWAHYSRPRPGESLSKWLRRIANDLSFYDAQTFLSSIGFEPVNNLTLDFSCPPEIISKIAELTGLSRKSIRDLSGSFTVDLVPSQPKRERLKIGYIWDYSEIRLSKQLNAMRLERCDRLIVIPPRLVKYSNIQRDIAKRELFSSPAGSMFTMYQLSSLVRSSNDLIKILDRLLRLDIQLKFAKDDLTFGSAADLEAVRKVDLIGLSLRRRRSPRKRAKTPDPRRVTQFGRTPILYEREEREAAAMFVAERQTVKELSRQFGTSLATMYRVIARHRSNLEPVQ